MPRPISVLSLNAMLASQTDQVITSLVRITLPDGKKFCLTNNSTNITNTEAIWNAFPYDVLFPTDREGQISTARLIVDNASRQLICEVRNIFEPFEVRLQIIRAADPEDIIASWDGFTTRLATYSAGSIVFDLTLEQLLNEPYPAGTFTPAGFPAIF